VLFREKESIGCFRSLVFGRLRRDGGKPRIERGEVRAEEGKSEKGKKGGDLKYAERFILICLHKKEGHTAKGKGKKIAEF